MTIVLGSCCLVLTILIGNFAASLGNVATYRARAQLAADSAALAAAVEHTIGGTGRPEEAAQTYAAFNGASIVRCDCDGLTEIQVEAEVGGVTAEARATVDPERFGPASVAASDGLDRRLAAAVNRLLEATDGAVRFGSGARDRAEQEDLWEAALERYGDPEIADDWVARPGTSMHERGLAVDLEGDLARAARTVSQLDLPLWRPMSYEPWHFELVGSRS